MKKLRQHLNLDLNEQKITNKDIQKLINSKEIFDIITNKVIKDIKRFDMPDFLEDPEREQIEYIKGEISAKSYGIIKEITRKVEDVLDEEIENKTDKLAKDILDKLKK